MDLIQKIDGSEKQKAAITSIYHRLDITSQNARAITDRFIKEMEKGLDHDGATGI